MVDDTNRTVHTDSSATVGVVAIVLIAVVLVLGFLFFIMGVFPFEQQQRPGFDVDVNLPDQVTPNGANLQNYLPDIPEMRNAVAA